MHWTCLSFAIVLEVGGIPAIKLSEGFFKSQSLNLL